MDVLPMFVLVKCEMKLMYQEAFLQELRIENTSSVRLTFSMYTYFFSGNLISYPIILRMYLQFCVICLQFYFNAFNVTLDSRFITVCCPCTCFIRSDKKEHVFLKEIERVSIFLDSYWISS